MDAKTILLIILIPIISSAIGWFTNYIAIKSLFKPVNKKRILFFNIQGLIPKRKKSISKNIALVVEEYLFSHKDIIEIFEDKKNIDKIKKRILPIIEKKILEKIPEMFRIMAKPIISKVLNEQIEEIIIKIGKELSEHALENINITEIITKKLENYEIDNFEKIIYKIASKELKHIEYLGAFIGFIIGIFQIVLILTI